MIFILITRFIAAILSIGLIVLASGARSQDYPNKPIRIVTGSPGGQGDFASRLIAQGISTPLGQQVVVDNRGDFTGTNVVKAPPDGYTLLVDGSSFWIGSLLKEMPYDPVRDFSPIIVLAVTPNVLVVHPSVPASSVKELVALAKARPGALNYAAGAIGGSNHLAAELFKSMAGVEIVRVNYKGAGPALIGVVGGEVQLSFNNALSVAPHVKAGRLRALAVASSQPSALVPGLPTVSASGLPGYESVSPNGVFAPVKTSTAVINRLNQEIARVLNQAEVKQKFFDSGSEVVGGSPEQAAATVKADMARWGKVIKDAGIKAD